ncbi:MAG TPA: transcription termination/antitermination protein NusA, partial [Bacteroidetes bacterium]|nr:transcription termination/antitermination protein NusA [Bacteroidota bacterium]
MAKENEIVQAAKQICEEKNISFESVIETIEAALAVAYRKDFGEKNENIKVEFDIEKASSKVFDVKTVVAVEKFELKEKLKEEKLAEEEADEKESKKAKKEESSPTKVSADKSADKGDDFERFNPKTEITLSDAKKLKKGAKLADEIKTELTPPAAYGRMAAQTAKQVIVQRLREAEREMVYKEFKDKEGDVINGTIQRIEGRMVLVDLGPTTALLPPGEQVPRERYASGQRFKFYVVAVNETPKGPEIILSRAHVDMVRKLFYLEVPEVGNGSVEIKSISREAGSRTKIAVYTTQKNIDPVGSCVGQRGSRVQTIISEIGGEKIDIIEWDEDPVKFITNALSPAKVLSVTIKEEEKIALVEVKEDQLSLAIGKSGQNVRLS